MRIGSNKGSEVEAYTDFIKEAEGLKSTLRTAWTAEGRRRALRSTPGAWLCLPG